MKRPHTAKSKPIAHRAIASSRLTIKGQATVPLQVRKKLQLKPGDTLMFEDSGSGAVLIRKAEPLDLEFLASLEKTLSEWGSENDERSYSDL